MTLNQLLEQFEKELRTYYECDCGCHQIDTRYCPVIKGMSEWLRTHLTKMFNRDEAFQHGFMSGYKAGRESYETQMRLQNEYTNSIQK